VEEKKYFTEEGKRTKELERNIARTLEENYCVEYENDLSIKIIKRVRDKITEKYSKYEQALEELFIKKQKVKETIEVKQKKVHIVTKIPKETKVTEKLTSDEYQLSCLKQIVDNENNRVYQRLQIVRDKTRILKDLINNEDDDFLV
jgi:hypothetical protein